MSLMDDFFGAVERVAPTPQIPTAIATVDAGYSGTGPAQVRFDGETVVSGKTYKVLTKVVAGDRVVMLATGNTWVIVGSLAGGGNADTLDGIDSTGFVQTARHDTAIAALRSQIGGFVSSGEQFRWSGGRLYWTGRLISIAHGRGAHWSASGWFGFYCPAPGSGGVIPGYGGHGGFSVDATEGIPIGSHQALYGVPTIGGTATATSLALVNYTADFVVPDHWVLIAVTSESDGRVMLGNGTLLDYPRELTYINGSSAYDYGGTAKMEKIDGVVYLTGIITKAAADACVQLPVGYRPGNHVIGTSKTSGGFMEMRIHTAGDIQIYGGAQGWAGVHASFPARN